MVPCGRVPATLGGRQALRGMVHRSTALGICAAQAISVMGTCSLCNFGWGMGEGNGAYQNLFSPSELCPSGAQQLSLPVSCHPSHSPISVLLTFNISNVNSTGCQISQSPAPLLLQASLLPYLVDCLSTTLAPSCQSV